MSERLFTIAHVSFNPAATGTDVTIVTFSKMVGIALEAAEILTAQGISAEVGSVLICCI